MVSVVDKRYGAALEGNGLRHGKDSCEEELRRGRRELTCRGNARDPGVGVQVNSVLVRSGDPLRGRSVGCYYTTTGQV